jgi:hypothetical protein
MYEDMPTNAECEAEERESKLKSIQDALDLINKELIPAINWTETDAYDMVSQNIDWDQTNVDLAIEYVAEDIRYFLDNIIGIATQAEDLL